MRRIWERLLLVWLRTRMEITCRIQKPGISQMPGFLPAVGGIHIPSTRTKNANTSAAASIRLVVGVPAPWPARVSMRINAG